MSELLWQKAIVRPSDSIVEALRHIDAAGLQIALVVDESERLIGTVTDGDVRRGILRGVSLEDGVRAVMNAHPTVATPASSREEILGLMKALGIRHIPLVDADKKLIGLQQMDELLVPEKRENVVVLMAGGLGKRLSPMTDQCPKPMLQIGGRPILETIVLNFIEHGFHRFYFSVNHKAEMIERYFEDGSRWNVQINYIHECEPLGTAGSLGLIEEKPALPMVVMNGDVLTRINLDALLKYHEEQNAAATMCVREFEYQVPYGVIKLNGHEILKIEEKPTQKFFVNAGVYVLNPEIHSMVKPGEFLNMTDLLQNAVERKHNTSVFPIREYWIDIGQHSEFAKAQEEFKAAFPK